MCLLENFSKERLLLFDFITIQWVFKPFKNLNEKKLEHTSFYEDSEGWVLLKMQMSLSERRDRIEFSNSQNVVESDSILALKMCIQGLKRKTLLDLAKNSFQTFTIRKLLQRFSRMRLQWPCFVGRHLYLINLLLLSLEHWLLTHC